MAEYLIQDTTLIKIADEIRILADTVNNMTTQTMISNLNDANSEVSDQTELISQIQVALKGKAIDEVEITLQDKIITPTISKQIITADSGYDGLDTVTVNAMPTATQAIPSISVNSSGLITVTATQSAGYVSAGTESATKQLAFQAAKTITPTTADQIAVSSGYYTGGTVTVKGDSNLVAANIKSGVSIFGVSGTLEEGSGSSEVVEYSEAEDAMVTGTLSTYTNDRVTSIGNYAFYSCSSLTLVSFPVCTSIGHRAFYSCSRLTSINFPACKSIGTYAFYNCSRLTSISFPVCTSIYGNAFYNCSKLTSVNFPACTSIYGDAFRNCSRLTSISFPACTFIGNYAFDACFSLTTISFPVCKSISEGAFADCSSLTTISFPVCASIGSIAFQRCSSLTLVNLPACTNISDYTFRSCYTLSSLTLGASTICTLSNSNAFISTPYAGYSAYFSGTPWIYVPSSLVASYQAATNWVYFSSYFSAIEDSGGDIITFTIDGREYHAQSGMTWAEWCDSEYDTAGYYYNNSYVMLDISSYVRDQDYIAVNPSAEIIADYAYLYGEEGE